jgi:hypothetical protein
MKVGAILTIYNLFEANIFNIKDEYQGVSIAGYLKQFVDNLPAQHQKPFIKKITMLLVNDERFHYAVREVPADAPDWAKTAVAAQQLQAFKPTQDLTDTLTHITHYLSAAADDATKSPSPDQRIVAQRELDAFPKAENLDVIKKKSDIFFTRGSRKAGRDVAGAEQIFDSGGGYIWYKLVEPEAFKREGKALQNCIGSIYTADRVNKDGAAIVVLKNPSNESVVAMRINVEKRQVDEMKGKNNRPPIEKYMTPTLKFVNHMKLVPSSGAMYDLRNAGYYYDEKAKEILTKAQAIQRLVKATPIADIGHGLTLVKATVASSTLFQSLYPSFSLPYSTYGITSSSDRVPPVYELRNTANQPVISAHVLDKRLNAFALHTLSPTAVQEADTGQSSKVLLLIQALLNNDIITSIAPNIQRQVLWREQKQWDPATNTFKSLDADAKNVEVERGYKSWKLYTNKNIIKQWFNSLQTREDTDTLGGHDAKDIMQIYVGTTSTHEDDEDQTHVTHLILQTRSGDAVPVRAVAEGDRDSVLDTRYGFEGTSPWGARARERDQKAIDALLSIAKKNNLSIPKMVRIHHGIVRTEKTFKQFEPKFEQVSGKVPAVKLDLSALTKGDRLAALAYIGTNDKWVDVGSAHASDDILKITKRVQQSEDSTWKTGSDFASWRENEIEAIYDEMFDGKTPETLYVVDVTYGVDKAARVTMLADNKQIVRVDTTTTEQTWQKWSDYDTVATQLNQFAEQHGLQFDENALMPQEQRRRRSYTPRRQQGELRVGAGGKVTTASVVKTKEIEAARLKGRFQMEGTDELTFANGARIQRMTPEEQADWYRQDLRGAGGSKGEAWKIFNKDNKLSAVFTVANGKLVSMFGPGYGQDVHRMKYRGIIGSLLPYVKAAAQTFKWKMENAKSLQIRPNGRMHNTMKAFNYGSRRRQRLRDLEALLYGIGMVRLSSAPTRGRTKTYVGTERLKSATKVLDDGKALNLFDYVTAATLPEDFVAPARRVLPTRERKWAASTAAPRTGTKAEQALAKFREMTTANNQMPTRSEFIQLLTQPPFNMSRLGAQTYYYTTKAKYAALGESFSALAALQLRNDPILRSLKAFLIS